MKQISVVFCVVFSLFVTACSKEEVVTDTNNVLAKISGKDYQYIHQERPQEPQKPAILTNEEIQAKIIENQEFIKSKIVKEDGKTVYYFIKEKDKDGNINYHLTDDKNKATDYRVILGTTIEGFCAVQDFYANGQKRKEPLIITEKNDCQSLGRKFNELYLTKIFYNKNGNIGLLEFNEQEKFYQFLYNNDKNNNKVFLISEIDMKQSKLTDFAEHPDDNPKIGVFVFDENKQVKDIYAFLKDGIISHYDLNSRKMIVWEKESNDYPKTLAAIKEMDEEVFSGVSSGAYRQTKRIKNFAKLYQIKQQALSQSQ